MERFGAFIDNEVYLPRNGRYFPTENPATGQPWAEVLDCAEADVDAAVMSADLAFRTGPWATMLPHDRAEVLRNLADVSFAHAEELAVAETRDNGKLLVEMRAQCRYLKQWLHYYAGLADKIEGRVLPVDKANTLVYTRREPLGVVAAIVPWNSPLLLAVWKIAPALSAGNTVVIKPSEFTSTSTLLLMQLWAKHLPKGVINVVTGKGPTTGQLLVDHPKVRKIAFTGGENAGISIGQAAIKRMVPVTLELGGKSANIVFPDADLDNAVKGACAGIFAASGQTCIAGSRLLLHREIADRFLEKFLGLAKSARIGDPSDPQTQVGPVTTLAQYERILGFIERTKAAGAELLLGGAACQSAGSGWFIEPTVFAQVTPDMEIWRKEVFGPVLAISTFETAQDAIELANDVDYGLAAGIWTKDLIRAHRVAGNIEAGNVWINTYRTSAPQAPFGGYKMSGLGREGGQQAIEQYVETKAVWVDMNSECPNPFVMRL